MKQRPWRLVGAVDNKAFRLQIYNNSEDPSVLAHLGKSAETFKSIPSSTSAARPMLLLADTSACSLRTRLPGSSFWVATKPTPNEPSVFSHRLPVVPPSRSCSPQASAAAARRLPCLPFCNIVLLSCLLGRISRGVLECSRGENKSSEPCCARKPDAEAYQRIWSGHLHRHCIQEPSYKSQRASDLPPPSHLSEEPFRASLGCAALPTRSLQFGNLRPPA
jgi:hypothetical protein